MTSVEFCVAQWDLLIRAFEHGIIGPVVFQDVWTATMSLLPREQRLVRFDECESLRNLQWRSFDSRDQLDNVQFKQWTPTTTFDDYTHYCKKHGWISDTRPCPTCERKK